MLRQNGMNWSLSGQEMRFKKRLLVVVSVVLIAAVWIISVRSRGDVLNRSVSPEQEIALLRQKVTELTASCDHKGQLIPKLPVIYAITPTYTRPVQKAELTRLSHTLVLVPNLHWIIVEDAQKETSLVSDLLKRSNVRHTHLVMPTPKQWKLKEKDPNWKKPRGVLQRNAALQWIRENLNTKDHNGVIYFADDDNAYSLELFDEMRYTRGVSVWPVGLVGGLMVEKPLLDKATGKVIGWNSGWKPERPFPLDMAGFAVNLSLFLRHPEAKFSFDVDRGYQESAILSHLTTRDELEPKADNCTKVFVWHTRTEMTNLVYEKALLKKGKRSDNGIEV